MRNITFMKFFFWVEGTWPAQAVEHVNTDLKSLEFKAQDGHGAYLK